MEGEAISKDIGRSSLEDLADAYSTEFAGADGLAKAMYKMAFDPGVRAATRFKIISKVEKTISDASRLYGDRAKLAAMETAQIERRLVELLLKHHGVVPIPGVDLARSHNQSPTESPEGTPAGDRADQG